MSAAARRTFAPVRRRSYHRGEREHRIWNPLGKTKPAAKRFRTALIVAAKRFDESTKEPGDHWGKLGPNGVKVLETLAYRFVDLMTGRLEPAIATIMEKAKLARATVCRALARLREHGFLDWVRRTEPTEIEGEGPQVRQITNAYWFALRGRAAGLVRLILGKAPPDVKSREQMEAEAEAERSARLASMRTRRSRAEVAGLAAGAFSSMPSEVRETLKARAERRGASSLGEQNPGLQGKK